MPQLTHARFRRAAASVAAVAAAAVPAALGGPPAVAAPASPPPVAILATNGHRDRGDIFVTPTGATTHTPTDRKSSTAGGTPSGSTPSRRG